MTEGLSPLATLRKTLSAARDIAHATHLFSSMLLEVLGFEDVRVIAEDSTQGSSARLNAAPLNSALLDSASWASDSVLGVTVHKKKALFISRELALPIFISDASKQQVDPALREAMLHHGVKSYVAIPIFIRDDLVAVLEASTSTTHLRVRGEEKAYLELGATLLGLILERRLSEAVSVAEESDDSVDEALQQKEIQPIETPARTGGQPTKATAPSASDIGRDEEVQRRSLYRRVAEYGELLIVRTDALLRVTELLGDTQKLFGIPAEELLGSPRLFQRCFRRKDLRRILRRVRSSPSTEFSDEVQVMNRLSGEYRWILMRAIPVTDSQGVLLGWEGFWVDFTARRSAEERLRMQSRRIEALYEVAHSLELNLDPSVVALKGLRALLRATASDCGFSGLIDTMTGQLEVVAAEGLSSRYIEEVGKIIGKHTLAGDAVERREGLLLKDIQQEPKAAVELAREEGVHATIIMPLVFEEHVLGVMVLFRRNEVQYSSDDYDLVAAACSQIGLAARQAELYAAEKRQSSSLSALYRLSHELSKQMTLKEVAEQAFPAIQEEIACKRMWLGVLNNRGSHLMGTAGVGPGIRKHVIDLQIELGGKNELLERAIKTRSAVIFDATREVECGDLGKVLSRLNCGTVVLVPLVSLGQVVGVLVVEPAVPSTFFVQRKLPLLNSMATEIATVILARKFESRMADADKMRMAGLLASGVAHNFNNLLQAVMGQASLIEIQMSEHPKVVQSARMIAEAASKGAGLVKQLFNFSMQGSFTPNRLSIQQFLDESKDLYRSVLGSEVRLDIEVADNVPAIIADSSQLQQVITNLLLNSHDALAGKADGVVKVIVRGVRVRSGEVDPELSPGEYLRIEVEDNGEGMTPESLSRCFEPFFTTKNIDTRTGLGFGGSGLGLSSAYSIVKQHDGVITVRSQFGVGTTFAVYLPAAPVATESVAQVNRATSGDAPPLGSSVKLQVLMFEIDSAISYSLRSSIETSETAISIPLTRERLMTILSQSRAPKALVLVDLDRLGTKAPEYVSTILDVSSHVMLFGYVANPSKWTEGSFAHPRCRIFEKPLRMWAITEEVRRVLEQPAGDTLSNQVARSREPLHEAGSTSGVVSGNLAPKGPVMPPFPEELLSKTNKPYPRGGLVPQRGSENVSQASDALGVGATARREPSQNSSKKP